MDTLSEGTFKSGGLTDIFVLILIAGLAFLLIPLLMKFEKMLSG